MDLFQEPLLHWQECPANGSRILAWFGSANKGTTRASRQDETGTGNSTAPIKRRHSSAAQERIADGNKQQRTDLETHLRLATRAAECYLPVSELVPLSTCKPDIPINVNEDQVTHQSRPTSRRAKERRLSDRHKMMLQKMLNPKESVPTTEDNVQCRVLFATHFFDLARNFDRHQVQIQHMACRVEQQHVQFLYELRRGEAPNGSCGIAVAAMAGIPQSVILAAARAAAHFRATGAGNEESEEISCLDRKQMQAFAELYWDPVVCCHGKGDNKWAAKFFELWSSCQYIKHCQ